MVVKLSVLWTCIWVCVFAWNSASYLFVKQRRETDDKQEIATTLSNLDQHFFSFISYLSQYVLGYFRFL